MDLFIYLYLYMYIYNISIHMLYKINDHRLQRVPIESVPSSINKSIDARIPTGELPFLLGLGGPRIIASN